MAQDQTSREVPNIVPQELKQYLIELLAKKGGDKLPPEIQARALADLTNRFADFLIINSTNTMTPEQQDEFEMLLSGDVEAAQVTQFLKEKIDFPKVLEETGKEFEQTFLGK